MKRRNSGYRKQEAIENVTRLYQNTGPLFLDEILEWCFEYSRVDTLLFTSRPSTNARAKEYSYQPGVDASAREILGKNLLEVFEAHVWPGTKLFGHVGRVYVGKFDQDMKQRMIEVENELFKWRHTHPKELPEDICLFRTDDEQPTLISVTHEGDAWVIAAECPPKFRLSDVLLDAHIGKGRYFCFR